MAAYRPSRVVVASCGRGSRVVTLGSDVGWLDDSGALVAWRDGTSIRFTHGAMLSSSMSWRDIDPSGQFFLVKPRWHDGRFDSSETKLRSVRNPALDLAVFESADPNARVFSSTDKVVVVGDSPTDRKLIAVREFVRSGNSLRPLRAAMHQKPGGERFFVVDVTPSLDEIAFLEARDFPTKSRLWTMAVSDERFELKGEMPAEAAYLGCSRSDLLGSGSAGSAERSE